MEAIVVDSLKDIAIAEIVSFLSKHRYVRTFDKPTIWEEILKRAGQKRLFEIYRENLSPYKYVQGHSQTFRNDNPLFEQFYHGLYSIFEIIYDDGNGMSELTLLLEIIFSYISIYELVDFEDIDDDDWYDEIEEKKCRLRKQWNKNSEYQEFVNEHLEDEAKRVIRSLNILSLDLKFEKEDIIVQPYNKGSFERTQKVYSLEQWLHINFPKCEEAYNDALNNFTEGRYGSCIADCRVALTGLFSQFKETENWFNGILNLNHENYKDPEIIKHLNNATKILHDKIDGNFPRFKAIYKIYGMFCDLGAHRTEGVIEETLMADALLSIRFTEDIMIWAMQMFELKLDKK